MTENYTNHKDNSLNNGLTREINTQNSYPDFAMTLANSMQQNDQIARRTVDQLMAVTQHRIPDFKITDKVRFFSLASRMGIDVSNKKDDEIAENLAASILIEFKKQDRELFFTSWVPQKRLEIWRRQGVVPRGIEQEIAEIMSLNQGKNGHDPEFYFKTCIRAALADFLGTNLIRTEVQDILFGTPRPTLIQKDPEIEFIGGFSSEAIRLFGGYFRASYQPVLDNITNGRIRGVAIIMGSGDQNNSESGVVLVRELIKNDILVMQAGSSASESAKAGLMVPEASTLAGDGLASVCEAVGIPPVLHFGSDNEYIRIMVTALNLVKEGSLKDVSDLPLAVSLLGEANGNNLSAGLCLTAFGLFTVADSNLSVSIPAELVNFFEHDSESMYGGKWVFEVDVSKKAGLIMNHIDFKRKSLGIDKSRERVLFDMAMRRGIE